MGGILRFRVPRISEPDFKHHGKRMPMILWLVPVIFGCVGACIGSFIGCMNVRYSTQAFPTLSKMLLTPSRCDFCGEPIPALKNIPIISYLKLNGKTSCCETVINSAHFKLECVCFLIGTNIGFSLAFIAFVFKNCSST